MSTVRALLQAGAAALAGSESARLDAEVLLGFCLDDTRTALYAHPERVVADACAQRYRSLVRRRAAGVPVAYLTGQREFWSLTLRVTPSTLVPRPETELLVAEALERMPRRGMPRVVDLGTGCGAVALALATERPGARMVASDVSAAALDVARTNARTLGHPQLALVRTSWMEGFAAQAFDLVAANPPYVADHDPHLERGDPAHEPRLALAAGPDGLDAVRAIASAARSRLRPGGWLLLEHGRDQGAAVRALLAEGGYRSVGTAADAAGLERVSAGRRA